MYHRAWLGVSVQKWLEVAGKDHITWIVGLKMDWRGRLGMLDWLDGPNGDKSVRADQRLKAGGWNGSATIGS